MNCFAPTENPYFHTDCDEEGSITFLYYSSDEWNLDLGGENNSMRMDNERLQVYLQFQIVWFSLILASYTVLQHIEIDIALR